MAEDVALLLELLDDSDEVKALLVGLQDGQKQARDDVALATCSILTVAARPLPRSLETELGAATKEFHCHSDSEFFSRLRITKPTFAFLLSIMDKYYSPVHRGGYRPVESQSMLTLGLRYLGSRCTYRQISQELKTSEANVFVYVQVLVNILCLIASEFLHWPQGDQITEIESGFSEVAGMPGVVGVVGDCQIKMKNPAIEGTKYLNNDKEAMLHLLAICDDKLAFTYVNVGYPGSADEEEVLRSTSLYQMMEEQPLSLFGSPDHHIIGSSAYPASKYLLIPFRDVGLLLDEEEEFNQRLSQTRLAIEKAFALLKARFHRLHFFDAEVKKIPNLVKACCILHNVTLRFPEEQTALANEESISLDNVAPQAVPLFSFDSLAEDLVEAE